MVTWFKMVKTRRGTAPAVWPADSSKVQVIQVVPLDLQGQNQGQTTGNALAPKLTVRLRLKVVSNDSPSKVLASQSSFKVVPLDLQGQIQGQTTGNALEPKLTVRLRQKWSQTIPRPKF